MTKTENNPNIQNAVPYTPRLTWKESPDNEAGEPGIKTYRAALEDDTSALVAKIGPDDWCWFLQAPPPDDSVPLLFEADHPDHLSAIKSFETQLYAANTKAEEGATP